MEALNLKPVSYTHLDVYKRQAQSDAGPITIELQGRTYSGIAGTGQGVTPRAIDFGPVRLGEVVRQKITFQNFDPSIPIVNWEYSWLSDDPSPNFDYTTTCGESLPGLGTCEVTVSYRPRHFGLEFIVLQVLNSQGIVDIDPVSYTHLDVYKRQSPRSIPSEVSRL